MEFLERVSEFGCYSGASLSGILAWRLFKMENKTFFNKMFLVYFSLDFVLGMVETFFLFKLYRERYEFIEFCLNKNYRIYKNYKFIEFKLFKQKLQKDAPDVI